MVALGWMNLLWTGLFTCIIFGEKIWSRGLWISRSAGIGLTIIGIMAILGLITIPSDMIM
jgi:predicted metal-binding membrane protein